MAQVSGTKSRQNRGSTASDGYLWYPDGDNISIGSSYTATSISVSFSGIGSASSAFPAYGSEIVLVFSDYSTMTVGYIDSNGSLPANGTYTGSMSGSLSLSGLSDAQKKEICSRTIIRIDLGAPSDQYDNYRDIKCSSSSSCSYTIYYETSGGGGGGGGGGTDYTASYITGVTSSVNIGSNVTVTFTGQYVSTLTHKITFVFGSTSFVQNASGGSCTVTVPTDWGRQIPSSSEGTATAVLRTYNGSTQIGDASSATFKVTVPSSYKPTVSLSVVRGGTNKFNVYVQALSTAKMTATATTAAGSPITAYYFSCGTTSETRSSNTTEIVIPGPTSQTTTTGQYSIALTCTVTDARGNTGSTSTTITAYAYSTPGFTSPRAIRCTSNGTPDENGTYFTASAKFTKAPVGNTNTATVTVAYRNDSSSTWSVVDTITMNTSTNVYEYSKLLGNGALVPNVGYSVRFTIKDNSDNTTEQVVSVSSAGYTMFFKRGGLGVGFGMVTTKSEPAVEFASDWSLYHGAYKIPTIHIGQTAPSETENVIWLKPIL